MTPNNQTPQPDSPTPHSAEYRRGHIAAIHELLGMAGVDGRLTIVDVKNFQRGQMQAQRTIETASPSAESETPPDLREQIHELLRPAAEYGNDDVGDALEEAFVEIMQLVQSALDKAVREARIDELDEAINSSYRVMKERLATAKTTSLLYNNSHAPTYSDSHNIHPGWHSNRYYDRR